MKQWLKTSAGYEGFRFLYRQIVPETHYPPPFWQRALYSPYSALEKSGYASGRISPQALTLPHFLGLGTLQAGTSWLWDNLRRHPEIYVPESKELHYFSWRFHRSLSSYARQLAPGVNQIRGEITTEYLTLPPERIAFVRKILPEARLVVLLRNPIDRAWAHAKQDLMFRPGKSFAEVREADWLRHLRSTRSRRAGDYIPALKAWFAIYPNEQLHIGFYDDLIHDPQRLLTDVFRHIGVSTDVDWQKFPCDEYPERVRESAHLAQTLSLNEMQDLWRWNDYNAAPPPPQYAALLRELYADQIEAQYDWFGEPIAAWRNA